MFKWGNIICLKIDQLSQFSLKQMPTNKTLNSSMIYRNKLLIIIFYIFIHT